MKPCALATAPVVGLLVPLLVAPGVRAQCGAPVDGSETAVGRVFDDLDLDGRQSPGEPGVAGVSVSNGCEVVVTDPEGLYRLDLAPGQILFVSQPSGYTVPVDENNLPQFFYRHYPDGTPAEIAGAPVEWLWPTIESTGPLPETIDFPIHGIGSTETRFSAHAFADPQARSDLDQDMLREDLVNTLLGNPYDAEFSLTVGDIVFDNLGLYDRHKEMMGLIGIPQWNLPGNHDLNFESPNARYANETYKKHFGPTYYSFNYGNVHVVALNNVEYAGAGQPGFDGDAYRGFISDNQLYWLERDLAHVPADRLIVIATHISLISEASDGDPAHDVTGPYTENFDQLLELLRPFPNVYGLAGHDTSNSWKVEIDHEHGWTGQPWIAHTLAEVRGSGWTRGQRDLRSVADAMMEDGNPNGFYLLKFDDVTLIPEFIPFPYGPDAARRLRVVLDPELMGPADGGINRGVLQPGTKVVVNLFDGGERDQVRLSLDGGAATPMRYVVRTDPFMEAAYRRFAGTDEAFVPPAPSAHIWEFDLPVDLAPGMHSVVVESEDEFGQERRGVLSFEVTAVAR